jgi:hypothetical protein
MAKEVLRVKAGCSIQHAGVTYKEGDRAPKFTRAEELFHAPNLQLDIEPDDVVETVEAIAEEVDEVILDADPVD